ncbi:hypothetical protein LA080_008217 [Diaporthe eres]|nr:hypothetical protein LA080_008217 [Diaporthe eres]
MGRPKPPPPDGMVDLEDSGIKPQTRMWILLARMIELCFTGTAVGLACHVGKNTEVSWWPPGAQDHEIIVSFVLVSILGVTSTVIGLIALCFKYDANDKMSKTGHKCYGWNFFWCVWLSLIYAGISAGALYHVHNYLGDAGMRCTGDAMKSHWACARLLEIVVSTGIGAGMAAVCAIIEAFRIKQWDRVLEQCERY